GQMGETLKQIDESPDQPLTIAGNSDCPLRITEVKVKEIPGALFTKLTGRVTELATVSSVPEVTLVNTSGRTVTGFAVIVRAPNSRSGRAFLQSDITLRPGESYTIKRTRYAGSEKVTVADAAGQIHEVVRDPGLKSERRWIQFAAPSDLFVTIGKVDFRNGESWIIKEQGDVR
ncbi:MAG: hypothetical protein ACREDR_42630, partial [Blastocatellia bacterium]